MPTYKTPKLTDAQEMHRKHHLTFEAPDFAELDGVGIGSIVKVCFEDKERMWAEIVKKEGDGWVARLDNDPVGVNYKVNDLFYLENRHIYSIFEKP